MTFIDRFFGIGFPSFLFNPVYIIRRGLYKAIFLNKKYIRGNVLDFGCGEKPYKNIFNFDSYEGLDFPKTGHDNKNNDIEIWRNGKCIPRKNETYDSFICTEVLEHIFDVNNVIDEINRVLKINSYGIITTPFFFGEHEIPYDYARYTYFYYENMLKNKGFKIIKHERLGNCWTTILLLNRLYLGNIISNINNKLVRGILKLFLFPIHIIINLLSFFPSKDKTFYLNNFLVVQKIKNV